MFEPKTILLATDFSTASVQAFPHAAWFARHFGARLTLVYVVPETLPAELSHIGVVLEENRLVAEAEKTIARLRAAELPPDVDVETRVLGGGPSHQICQAAGRLGSDLIVLATRGYAGLKHFLMGSTAERVVRHAPCSVLAVHSPVVPVRLPVSPPCRFQRILAVTDFSPAATLAVGAAADLAGSCGASLSLLHVVESPNYPSWGYAHLSFRDDKLKKKARQKLNDLGAELEPVSCDILIRTGDAALKIVQAAEELDPDLLVLGSSGRSGFTRLLLGSVAEKVIRLAPCPILVFRERASAKDKR